MAHGVCMFLVYAEHNSFGKTIGFPHKFSQMSRNGFSSFSKRYHAFKILGLVFVVGDFSAISIQVVLARSPSHSVPSGHDPVDSVGCKEPILDALSKTIGINRIPEIFVGVSIVFAKWRRRHAELKGRVKILQYFTPITGVSCASPVALVHDDEVEKVPWVFLVETWPSFIFCNGLVNGKVHFATLIGFPIFNFPTGVPHGCEDFVFRIID